jgi:hypothetical protein
MRSSVMIPGGVLKREDGTYDVWCHIQDGHEYCGNCKTLARAKRAWVDAEKAYNHRKDITVHDAPVYHVHTETKTVTEAVRIR